MDESTAIRQLKRGDINRLEWLVDHHHQKAIQVAFLITCDLALAEDVVQDAFINAYSYIAEFDERQPFAPWFLRIVANLAVQKAQKQARQVSLDAEVNSQDFEDAFFDTAEPVEEQVMTAERKQRVWDAIQQLSPRQRAVIIQRYFLEMSEKEMTETLRSRPGTVKWRLNQARKALLALLSPERDRL
jgi:RNA polymerase sigma-70 factor, ECF subfamily